MPQRSPNDNKRFGAKSRTVTRNKPVQKNIDIETNDSLDESFYTKTSRHTPKNIIEKDLYNLQEQIQLIETETQLDDHLQDKLDKLTYRLEILQKKYSSYKRWYDRLNIMIIVISSILSIMEATRNELIFLAENNKTWEVIFNMVPLSVSTFITGTAAVIQFQKYQEKMENMQFTKEKVILAMSKIKHIQEMILFHDNFDNIKKKYFEDIYGFYNESNSEIERQLLSDATEDIKIKEKKRLHEELSEKNSDNANSETSETTEVKDNKCNLKEKCVIQ